MPWRESSVMEERLRFVARLLDGEPMTDLCREFGISRKTGYKVFNRYREHGCGAFSDRSRRPVRYANQLPQQVESLIVTDTNKYANNPKTDFLNWSVINAGTFDYAGDAWGYTYGAAAEWYQGRWTFRGGVFDLSASPAGGVSPIAYGLDPTFDQFQLVGEIEERHELWGQPGKIKITGFLSRGRAGEFADAVALSELTGQPADINAVRQYRSRPGVSLNLEQQVSETLGVFARAGWADGNVEPWDFTDIDRTIQAGVSLSGKLWGRLDDMIGIAGVVNGIAGIHEAFLDAGGLGILVGDGQLSRARANSRDLLQLCADFLDAPLR